MILSLRLFFISISANHVNRDQLLQRNAVLLGRVRRLYHVVNSYKERFVLDGFVFSFEGCYEERHLSGLRRDIEVWLLNNRCPP